MLRSEHRVPIVLVSVLFLCAFGCSSTNSVGTNASQSGLSQPLIVGYVANSQGNSITSFSIDQGSGHLEALNTASTGSFPASVALSIDQRVLFVSNALDGTISTFTLDGKGGMIPTGPALHLTDSSGQPHRLLLAPSGRFLFVGSTANAIEVFSVDLVTGGLQAVPGSPFRVNSIATALALTHSGQFLYAFGDHADVIYCFSVDSNTGILTQLPASPIHTGVDPLAEQVDIYDKYLLVTTSDAQVLLVFNIHSDGSLGETATSRVPLGNTGAVSLNFSPDNKLLFIVVLFANNIRVFAFDSTTGLTTPVPGSPFHDGQVPSAIALTPNGKILVVTRLNPGSMTTYQIDTSGGLSPISGSNITTGSTPNDVVLAIK